MKKNGVICAIDVNDYDQDVIDFAASFAKQFGVKLDLLHVTLFPNTAHKTIYAYVGSSSVYRRERRMLEALTTSVEGVELEIHHLSGYPGEQVVGFANRNQPRMLVLGTHGRQGLARILGSVASYVLRNVTCPVMVLRQRQNNQKFGGQPSNSAQAESGHS
jgi:universal stress protein A